MRESTTITDTDRVNSVVYFTAPWCRPCQMLGPAMEDIATSYENLNFIKVNVDDAPQLVSEFRVQSVPTVMLLINGEVRHSFHGIRPKQEYEKVFGLYNGVE